ncbi:hypothetical protein F5B19DRAFT_205602 [Rostrohypoxylon terebratum]|nr:hypothetical protein F5B19DRAFT_205602 [Rostrohypoxylon terebratum]
MKFSSVYSAAFLLTSLGIVGSTDPTPTPPSRTNTRPESIETITITSWSMKDITKNDPEYWGADEVKFRSRELFSPTRIVDLIDMYTDLVQSTVVRSQRQLLEAKAASRRLNSSADAYGDWWERRKWNRQVPQGEVWFDGTLAEGLAQAIHDTVHRDIHHLYDMGHLLSFDVEAQISEKTREKLVDEGDRAITALNHVASGQSQYLIPRMDALVTKTITGARQLADNLEEFALIVAKSIATSVYRGPVVEESILRTQPMSTRKAAGQIFRNMRDSVFGTKRPPVTSKKAEKGDPKEPLEQRLLKLYASYLTDFLEEDKGNSGGVEVLLGVHYINEYLRRGLEGSRVIHNQTTEVVARANKELMEIHQPSTKWLLETVETMITNLNRTALIQGYSEEWLAEAVKFHSDLGKMSNRRLNQLSTVLSRARGLEPGPHGQEPRAGELLRTGYNEETKKPIFTQYLYNYEIKAPWKSVNQLREAANRLEYVWSTLTWCEDELEYLNICWDVKNWSTDKKYKLAKRFRRPGGRYRDDAGACSALANPLIMDHMCIDHYNFGELQEPSSDSV